MSAPEPDPKELDALVSDCLNALADDPAQVRSGIEKLAAMSGERASFLNAFFTLELARNGDSLAKTELPEKVMTLLKVYRDPATEQRVLAKHFGLSMRWKRVRAVLAEFDRAHGSDSKPSGKGEPPPDSSEEPEPARAAEADPEPAAPPPAPVVSAPPAAPAVREAKTDPELPVLDLGAVSEDVDVTPDPEPKPKAAGPAHPPANLDAAILACYAHKDDLKRLEQSLGELERFEGPRVDFALCLFQLELARLGKVEARREFARRAPLLLEAYRSEAAAGELIGGSGPLSLMWDALLPYLEELVPALGGQTEQVCEVSDLEVEQEVESFEVLPPPPPRKPPPPPKADEVVELSADEVVEEPSEDVVKFWHWAETKLGRLPQDGVGLAGRQGFAAASKADKQRLTDFAREALQQFPNVPAARALSGLTFLYLAGQRPKATLFGAANTTRIEEIRNGLLLLGDVEPAAQAAVLFQTDGPMTMLGFRHVVDAVADYLRYCLAENLDPRAPETVKRYEPR